jgi:hypothetical protein
LNVAKKKLKRGQKTGETLREFRKRQSTAKKAGHIVPGTWGGSRWDGRKKFQSRKVGKKFVNHQGRETITALIFGLVRANQKDGFIIKQVAKRFPDARFNNNPKKYLSTYRSLERKDAA